jgi:hypothetical protein
VAATICLHKDLLLPWDHSIIFITLSPICILLFLWLYHNTIFPLLLESRTMSWLVIIHNDLIFAHNLLFNDAGARIILVVIFKHVFNVFHFKRELEKFKV